MRYKCDLRALNLPSNQEISTPGVLINSRGGEGEPPRYTNSQKNGDIVYARRGEHKRKGSGSPVKILHQPPLNGNNEMPSGA